jgi:hypothetical protein
MKSAICFVALAASASAFAPEVRFAHACFSPTSTQILVVVVTAADSFCIIFASDLLFLFVSVACMGRSFLFGLYYITL